MQSLMKKASEFLQKVQSVVCANGFTSIIAFTSNDIMNLQILPISEFETQTSIHNLGRIIHKAYISDSIKIAELINDVIKRIDIIINTCEINKSSVKDFSIDNNNGAIIDNPENCNIDLSTNLFNLVEINKHSLLFFKNIKAAFGQLLPFIVYLFHIIQKEVVHPKEIYLNHVTMKYFERVGLTINEIVTELCFKNLIDTMYKEAHSQNILYSCKSDQEYYNLMDKYLLICENYKYILENTETDMIQAILIYLIGIPLENSNIEKERLEFNLSPLFEEIISSKLSYNELKEDSNNVLFRIFSILKLSIRLNSDFTIIVDKMLLDLYQKRLNNYASNFKPKQNIQYKSHFNYELDSIQKEAFIIIKNLIFFQFDKSSEENLKLRETIISGYKRLTEDIIKMNKPNP